MKLFGLWRQTVLWVVINTFEESSYMMSGVCSTFISLKYLSTIFRHKCWLCSVTIRQAIQWPTFYVPVSFCVPLSKKLTARYWPYCDSLFDLTHIIFFTTNDDSVTRIRWRGFCEPSECQNQWLSTCLTQSGVYTECCDIILYENSLCYLYCEVCLMFNLLIGEI